MWLTRSLQTQVCYFRTLINDYFLQKSSRPTLEINVFQDFHILLDNRESNLDLRHTPLRVGPSPQYFIRFCIRTWWYSVLIVVYVLHVSFCLKALFYHTVMLCILFSKHVSCLDDLCFSTCVHKKNTRKDQCFSHNKV